MPKSPFRVIPLSVLDLSPVTTATPGSAALHNSLDLARLAGLKPAGVICEIMREDGEMMRRPDLEVFCAQHNLKMCTVADLISYRLKREQFIRRFVHG